MLHRVVRTGSTLFDNRLMEITPEFLERTILNYKRKNYQFISLDQLHDVLSTGKKPKRKFVCFTFDDGYVDNYEIAYPIFRKYNCPFAIYVSTDFPNHKALLWWYVLEDILLANEVVELGDGTKYRCADIAEKNIAFRTIREKIFQLQTENMKKVLHELFDKYHYSFEQKVIQNALSWEQIRMLAKDDLCTIASHTVTHAALDKLDDKQVNFELFVSKKELEKCIEKDISHFAFPYGRYSDRVVDTVKQIGYKTAVLANGGKVRRDSKQFIINRQSLLEL